VPPWAGSAPTPRISSFAAPYPRAPPAPFPSPHTDWGAERGGEQGGGRGREMQMVFILLSFKC
jgi:hypothetical protein